MLGRMGAIPPTGHHRRPTRRIPRARAHLGRPQDLRRPTLPRRDRHRACRIPMPAFQCRRAAKGRRRRAAPLAPRRPDHRRVSALMGLPRERGRSCLAWPRYRAARPMGTGLHACGWPVHSGRNRRAAPERAGLHRGLLRGRASRRTGRRTRRRAMGTDTASCWRASRATSWLHG